VFLGPKEMWIKKEQSAIGIEFQIVGAAKVNERRPFAELISGTVSRCLSRDRKFLSKIIVLAHDTWRHDMGHAGCCVGRKDTNQVQVDTWGT